MDLGEALIWTYIAGMNKDDEKRIAAMMAKTLAMMCVRNTGLETLHSGIVPVTHAGDYSDVRVIDVNTGIKTGQSPV